MKVIHIIPSAFEYFDDIRAKAFKLIEGLYKLGLETEAFTLQYGPPTKTMKTEVSESSPSVHDYIGTTGPVGLIESLADFDIVHLHCPFFGAGEKILDWKKTHPDVPLVITFHRPVWLVDFFSLFIKIYNWYYLPKIFRLANVITCDSFAKFQHDGGVKYIVKDSSMVALDEVELEGESAKLVSKNLETVAVKTLLVYNNFYR